MSTGASGDGNLGLALVIRDFVPATESRHRRHWTEEEIYYLSNNFGVLTDETLARKLQRSELAIRRTAWRQLRMHRWDNLYNAAELAEALGIPHAGKIVRWVKKGWLKGRRSSIHKGAHQHWKFSEAGVVECLRKRPWLMMLSPTRRWLVSDYSHHFFYIVRKEWRRDPWYTTEQAAALLKVTARTIGVYIRRGLLEGEKTPRRQSAVWVIRRSAIQAFLANDPRPQHQFARVSILWVIKCPACGREVKVTASPQLKGPQVRERFIEQYVNGNCTHGGDCLLKQTYPVAEIRKGGESYARDGDTGTVQDN